LNPVKRKELIEKTAQQMELPVELVEDIVSFFYTTLRKRMSSGDYYSIQVPNLGQFVIKPKSLDRKMEMLSRRIPQLEEMPSMLAYEMKLQGQKDLAKFHEIKEKLQQERDRKAEIIAKRKSISNEQYNHTDLEEQGEDS
jgi:nucleoid DNA-binding protein